MPSLQDGDAFCCMVSTGFTRGYFHPAPPGLATRAHPVRPSYSLPYHPFPSCHSANSITVVTIDSSP